MLSLTHNQALPKKEEKEKKVVVRVYFNDSSFKTFAISENTSVNDLCAMFAKKIGIKGSTLRYFCLNIVLNGQSIHRLGVNNSPFKLFHEYTEQYPGWGSTNQNCFLFTLKSESAQRMTLCLNKPQTEAKIERIPTSKGQLFKEQKRIIGSTTPKSATSPPSSPPSTSFSPPSSSAPASPPTAKRGMAISDIERAIEFANTKLQRILDEASARQKLQNGENTNAVDETEEAYNMFMHDMEDLVSTLMQLDTPTSPNMK